MSNETTPDKEHLRQFLSSCKNQAIEEANKRKKEAFDELKKEFPEIRAELSPAFPLGECKFWLGNAPIDVFTTFQAGRHYFTFLEFEDFSSARESFFSKKDLGKRLNPKLEAYILGE